MGMHFKLRESLKISNQTQYTNREVYHTNVSLAEGDIIRKIRRRDPPPQRIHAVGRAPFH